ncbi:MAG: hypothetical protein LBQ15_00275 [Clostridium sp.]|nr:hypothetical protein [Clostridium sp.]
MEAFFLSAEIGLLADGCLRMILRYDPAQGLVRSNQVNKLILGYSLIIGWFLSLCLRDWGTVGRLGAGVLAAYLLVGSVTDLQTKEVYDFSHDVTAGIGIMLSCFLPFDKGSAVSLVVFCLLQKFLFAKMYGKADAKAFMVCALFESIGGGKMDTFLWHMLAAFAALAAVQAKRHNISSRGNLKQPVAFLPYIMLTVWPFL